MNQRKIFKNIRASKQQNLTSKEFLESLKDLGGNNKQVPQSPYPYNRKLAQQETDPKYIIEIQDSDDDQEKNQKNWAKVKKQKCYDPMEVIQPLLDQYKPKNYTPVRQSKSVYMSNQDMLNSPYYQLENSNFPNFCVDQYKKKKFINKNLQQTPKQNDNNNYNNNTKNTSKFILTKQDLLAHQQSTVKHRNHNNNNFIDDGYSTEATNHNSNSMPFSETSTDFNKYNMFQQQQQSGFLNNKQNIKLFNINNNNDKNKNKDDGKETVRKSEFPMNKNTNYQQGKMQVEFEQDQKECPSTQQIYKYGQQKENGDYDDNNNRLKFNKDGKSKRVLDFSESLDSEN